MKILVVGLGYVGTTLLAAINSKFRNIDLIGLDKSEKLIETFKKNIFPTYEKDLEKYFSLNNFNNLEFKTSLDNDYKFDYIIICVGTPIDNKKKIINTMLFKSLESIKKNMNKKTVLIIRSSVKVGTTDIIKKKIFKNQKINLAYCPERTVEGNAVKEIFRLPQYIGTQDQYTKNKTNTFFSKLTKTKINFKSFKEPEFLKLLDNYYRDTKFGFANEVAILCEKLGLNAKKLIQSANFKFSRNNIPLPGPVGGPCLSKDPYILISSLNDKKTKIYSREVNEKFVEIFSNKICKSIGKQDNKIKKVLLIGITFKGKPDTNDYRNSTALNIIKKIKKKFRNIEIFVYDKFVSNDDIKNLLCHPVNNLEKEMKNFKIIIIHGNNNYIKKLNMIKLSSKMKVNTEIFDIWNNYDALKEKISNKVIYKGLGI